MRHYPTVLTQSDPHYYEKQTAHHEGLRTTVEIQPSHSYEIKQTDHGYKTYYGDEHEHEHGHEHGHGHGQSYAHSNEYQNDASDEASPVILLKIPGTQKYAAHLQSLLKQYLEFRAAEYIQALREQEAHGSVEHAYNPVPMMPYVQQAYVAPIQGVLFQPIQASPFHPSPVDPYGPVGYGHINAQSIVSTPAPYYHQQSHLDQSGKFSNFRQFFLNFRHLVTFS